MWIVLLGPKMKIATNQRSRKMNATNVVKAQASSILNILEIHLFFRAGKKWPDLAQFVVKFQCIPNGQWYKMQKKSPTINSHKIQAKYSGRFVDGKQKQLLKPLKYKLCNILGISYREHKTNKYAYGNRSISSPDIRYFYCRPSSVVARYMVWPFCRYDTLSKSHSTGNSRW